MAPIENLGYAGGALVVAIWLVATPAGAQERIDANIVGRIVAAATAQSQVMRIAKGITDVGPRVTGSPSAQRAADWLARTSRSYGLKNIRLEQWGPFGRGWSNERTIVRMIAPETRAIAAAAAVWSVGTRGTKTGPAVSVRWKSTKDLEAYRGALRGAWVMAEMPLAARAANEPLRLADDVLRKMAESSPASVQPNRGPRALPDTIALRRETQLRKFLNSEGASGLIHPSGRDGTAVMACCWYSRAAMLWNAIPSDADVPEIVLTGSDYAQLWQFAEAGTPARLGVDVRTTMTKTVDGSFNLFADIPGTDPSVKDEVVLFGAHLDSWNVGTGATDDAAGCAVILEAARLLQSLGLRPRRTIRLAFWTGDEQGLLGVNAFVHDRVDPSSGQGVGDYVDIFFSVDDGAGRIRGLNAEGNRAAKAVFDSWLAAFDSPFLQTVSLGTAHREAQWPFDSLGVPAFEFFQDQVGYGSILHSTNDVYDRLLADDLKFNAAVVAAFAWLAADRDERFPRKPR